MGGLVTRYRVLVGIPPDAPELPTSLAHHQASFARVPAVLTADRAFFTLDNDQLARDLRIPAEALPRHGPLTAKHQQVQQRAAFRRAYRWRAGIEGRISVLKRRFGLDRCRYHGEAGMERGARVVDAIVFGGQAQPRAQFGNSTSPIGSVCAPA